MACCRGWTTSTVLELGGARTRSGRRRQVEIGAGQKAASDTGRIGAHHSGAACRARVDRAEAAAAERPIAGRTGGRRRGCVRRATMAPMRLRRSLGSVAAAWSPPSASADRSWPTAARPGRAAVDRQPRPRLDIRAGRRPAAARRGARLVADRPPDRPGPSGEPGAAPPDGRVPGRPGGDRGRPAVGDRRATTRRCSRSTWSSTSC